MKGSPLKYRLSDFLKGENDVPEGRSILILGTVIGATTLGSGLVPAERGAFEAHWSDGGEHRSIPHMSAHVSRTAPGS